MRSFACGAAAAVLAAAGAGGAEAPAAPAWPDAFVRQVKVLTDKAPDCSSLASIAQTVTRGCRTNDEKAVALYNFLRLACYHHAYPTEPGGISALKVINVYGWSLCGGLHTVEAALWRELGWPWRYVGWSDPGHTTVEAQYDGRWHYLDTFLKFYAWKADPRAPGGRTIASQDDLKADPSLVTGGLVFDAARKVYYHKGNAFEVVGGKANWRAPAFLVCGDEPKGILSGTKSNRQAGSPTGWGAIKFDDPAYSADVHLAPGYSLTLTWDAVEGAHWFAGRKNVPRHSCGDKEYRNCPAIGPILEPYAPSGGKVRSFASGTLRFAPDLGEAAYLASFAARDNVRADAGRLVPADPARPASVTVLLASPYVMTRAAGEAEGADKAELSLDAGKTYKAIDLKDFSDDVGGRYACLVRLSFGAALKSLSLEAIVQHNRCALAYLSPGPNRVAVSAADARTLGANRLVVTLAWRTGSRDRTYEQVAEAGAEVARAHYARWADTPVAVQKVLTAADLPAAFDVPVPTPKGKQPVYPRMLLVRREVLPPSARPLPPPPGAAEPKVGPDEELQVLPNPFLVGLPAGGSDAAPAN